MTYYREMSREEAIQELLELNKKLHERCKRCVNYEPKDENSFICYASTSITSCELFQLREDLE